MEKLLTLLSADETAAALAYTKLRESLVRFFQFRGDAMPDEAADQTLDRVADKISENVQIKDVTKFSFGAARLIALERFRSEQKTINAAKDFYESREGQKNLDEADALTAQRECLDALPKTDKLTLQSYFADLPYAELTARRQHLITESGVTLAQMRLKVFRLRKRLENCVRGKLEK